MKTKKTTVFPPDLKALGVNQMYVISRDEDIEKIKESIESKSSYKIKYSIRQLSTTASSFGDQYTRSICKNMLNIMDFTVNGDLTSEHYIYLKQSIDLLSLMNCQIINHDIGI